MPLLPRKTSAGKRHAILNSIKLIPRTINLPGLIGRDAADSIGVLLSGAVMDSEGGVDGEVFI
jgi:hypothetical protein